MTAAQDRPPDNSESEAMAHIAHAIGHAERARDRFDRELDGLIEDLRAAREAVVREIREDKENEERGGER